MTLFLLGFLSCFALGTGALFLAAWKLGVWR